MFTKGLHELGDGLWAYLQPDGSWGWSNAGLITGGGTSTLVDTLVNTHANGDHCYGNELVPDRAAIYATVAAAEEMREFPAALLHQFKHADDAEVAAFAQYAFGDFDFTEVRGRAPDRTFAGAITLEVEGRRVDVMDLGPAHTRSDSIVVVPDARTVFTGDLVFNRGTPIMWAGPVENWLRACDTLCALECDTYVPGHGPICGTEEVRTVQRYFEHVLAAARERHAAGMSSVEAAWDIDLGPFADLSDTERIVVTTDTIYAGLDPGHEGPGRVALFALMGRYQRGESPNTR